ncbi:MAG: outer membrane protein assembly factor BamE [Wenzhouxiangellaceae bacterium]
MLRFAFMLMVIAPLIGCNVVHKQNVQQGNVLEPDDMEQLEIGMTKRQVMVLLGSPAIQSPFHSDRWDYINSFARRGGKAEQRTLTVEFQNDQVSDFHGNYLKDARIAGAEIEELEIIDPNTNQPVLPRPKDDNNPLPDSDNPAGN